MPGRRFVFIIGLLIATFVIGGCNPTKASLKRPRPPESIDELKNAVVDILAKHHIPGIGIALVTKDKMIWAGGIGKADLATGRNVDADTMFRIGSITKGFVALSILQLQEKGKLSLNDRVSELAPEVPMVNPWEQTDPVRIANLLEHTAGFDEPPLAEFYDFSGEPQIPLLKTLQAFPGPQHVRWRPGTFASYSSPGYGVAGYIVEKVSGQPFEHYVAETILRPLGMTHSDLRLTPEIKATLAQGYEDDPPRPVPYLPILLRPVGEMKSSPNEMARFVRMMLNRGSLDGVRIVSAESIARMETPETGFAVRHGLKYGYGLGNFADVSHLFIEHGHDGGVPGFLSDYEYLPEQGVGYFFSLNDYGPTGQNFAAQLEINGLVFEYVTRGMTSPAQPSAVPLDSRIERATGFYEFATPRCETLRCEWPRLLTEFIAVWTSIDHGRLYRCGYTPGSRENLIYLGNGEIRTEKQTAPSVVYFTDADGRNYACTTLLACFRRTNPVWPVMRVLLLVAALLTMASSILFAFIWLPRKLLGRLRGVEHLSARVMPLLATLSLLGLVWRVWGEPARVLARADMVTMTIFAMSIVFPALSVTALVITLLSFRIQMNKAVRLHSILVAASCGGISWFFAYWGLIGVRIWAL